MTISFVFLDASVQFNEEITSRIGIRILANGSCSLLDQAKQPSNAAKQPFARHSSPLIRSQLLNLRALLFRSRFLARDSNRARPKRKSLKTETEKNAVANLVAKQRL
jgi:hypothetical protein